MESSSSSNSRRYRIHMAASNFIQAPLTALFDYSGLLGGPRPGGYRESEEFINGGLELPSPTASGHCDPATPCTAAGIHHEEEVSIRIIDNVGESNHAADTENGGNASPPDSVATIDGERGGGIEGGGAEGISAPPIPDGGSGSASVDGNRDTSHQRYDIQHIARWIEQILPFSLLLLVVFLRQHLQGFLVTIWISAVMFKSNDILRKQTALKGERETSVLVGITAVFILHVVCIYWWYQNDDLLYPLVLLPPKAIPPFWHALFIITVNDTMVRQAAMVFKSILLMYYKNSRGRDYRRQGQILTLIEYMLLLYRALLPTPVWYRFFLNREYGSLFSSLTTGLYLTFKLTSVIEKVRFFLTALRALSRKEVHYGSYATSEEVNAAGDLCAICQEKMHSPILLCCKHIFCEDCVSEWFERERTCPLCRALVKPADIRSYADGSTSLFFQLF